MDLLVGLVLDILLELIFEGVLEGFFELAGGRGDGNGRRPMDGTSRAVVFGVVTALTSLALGAWRGIARAEEGPGFGLVVAIVVAVVCAAFALRRRRAHVADPPESSVFTPSGRAVLPSWISSSLTTSRLVWFAIANALFAAAYVAGLTLAPTT